MQKCNRCGKAIKFIAISDRSCVICDAEPKLIYTAGGRMVDGFEKHNCGDKDGQKTETTETTGN